LTRWPTPQARRSRLAAALKIVPAAALKIVPAAAILALLAGCGESTTPPPTQALRTTAPTQPLAPMPASAAPEEGGTQSQPETPPPASRSQPTPPPPAPSQPETPAPAISQMPIPYGPARREQMAQYSLEHYGEDTYLLRDPKVIVEHFTETATAQEAYDTFAPDIPDNEFHELPNTCAHFLDEEDGRIDQLVPLRLRCRHTTGLNWTAIGIENVGLSDQEILSDHAQLAASLALTRWLRCRYHIALGNVIGHNESLSSPYHRDLVPAFQHQTHSDWNRADMDVYRELLRREPCAA
jgi:hypothetical protein